MRFGIEKPVDWPRILLAIIVTFGHCDAASKPTSKNCNVSLSSKVRTQALRLHRVVTCTDLSIEGFIHEFGYGIACFHQLERQQSCLVSRHCRTTHEDGIVQTSLGYNRCPQFCGSHPRRSSLSPWPSRPSCYQ